MRASALIAVVLCPVVSRESVCAAQVQVGPSEEQRVHHRLLHTADPGGTQVPARQPDRTQRHQGDSTGVTVRFICFLWHRRLLGDSFPELLLLLFYLINSN